MTTGLEGVVVAETRLSGVDGEAGRLWLCGVPVEELAQSRAFEGVCALFWQRDEGEVRRALGRARVEAFAALPRLGDALDADDGMEALRAALGHLSAGDDDAARVTGAMAVFTAAWHRRRDGGALAPDPEAGHAEDLHRMIAGETRPARAKALETYLSTVVDHGMNASTFAARVVASTESDLVSSVVAALGALKGKLHGGAPGPVLDMLEAVGTEENARPWLEAELAGGRRIMGMGHRVYRVRDPRAAVLERAASKLAEAGGADARRLALARAVEREAERLLAERHPDRPLKANVELATALLLSSLGVPRGLFTPLFACGRVVGWCAHVAEQRREGRLLRPRARYVGPQGSGGISRSGDAVWPSSQP
jgi:citrate synthase